MSPKVNNYEVVPLEPGYFSDGDEASWPKQTYWRRVSDELYRHKIAMMWMQERGRLEKGGLRLFII
jgi:hypothetical protein